MVGSGPPEVPSLEGTGHLPRLPRPQEPCREGASSCARSILAGGLGSRLSEETVTKPKPMVEIGSDPILWHILKHYAHYGYDDFVVALGYRGELIKQYFTQYAALSGDLTVRTNGGVVERSATATARDDWTLHLVDTGYDTATGGRMRRVGRTCGDDTFMMTFGDGVSDVDISQRSSPSTRPTARSRPITAVRPPARFGHVELDGDAVVEFSEKPQTGEGWINGGYMVLEPQVLDYIDRRRRRTSRRSRWNASRPTASSWPIATTASGSAWTRCATGSCSRACGSRGTRPGRSGTDAHPRDRERGLHRDDPVRLPDRARATTSPASTRGSIGSAGCTTASTERPTWIAKDIRAARPSTTCAASTPSSTWPSSRTTRSEQLNPEITFEINHHGSVRLADPGPGGRRRALRLHVVVQRLRRRRANATAPRPPTSHPLTAYAQCKVLVERDVRPMADDDFSPTFLRNATAFGASPRQRFDLVVNDLAGHAWTEQVIRMDSDGRPWRPFVHILDISQAIDLRASGAARRRSTARSSTSAATPRTTRSGEVAEIIAGRRSPAAASSSATAAATTATTGPTSTRSTSGCPDSSRATTSRAARSSCSTVFRAVDMTAELFEFRGHTRIKQIQHLLATGPDRRALLLDRSAGRGAGRLATCIARPRRRSRAHEAPPRRRSTGSWLVELDTDRR